MPTRKHKQGKRSGATRAVASMQRAPQALKLWAGPRNFRFKRTTNFANIAPLSVSGTLFKGSADAMTMLMASAGTPVQYGSLSLYFTLGDMPDYTEFTTLFDTYRLHHVTVKITPFWGDSATGAAVAGTSAQTCVLWHHIIDRDDASLPTASDAGVATLREYESYQTLSLARGRAVVVQIPQPLAAVAVYQASAFNAYGRTTPGQWLDAATPATQYFGYKAICEANNSGANTALYLKCEYTAYWELRDVR